jgi:hypothetical protein
MRARVCLVEKRTSCRNGIKRIREEGSTSTGSSTQTNSTSLRLPAMKLSGGWSSVWFTFPNAGTSIPFVGPVIPYADTDSFYAPAELRLFGTPIASQ